ADQMSDAKTLPIITSPSLNAHFIFYVVTARRFYESAGSTLFSAGQ
ncbi:MAG: hypothetical protein JWL62_147, partial [Hyphomicrobiales bacterium]|nr:hypothetical protein [Hyphomicrobiales bacterium]